MDTITHTLADGRTVTATEPVPGLRVYPVDPNEGSYDYTWSVGHHSGFVLAACDAQDEAEMAAREIAGFTDWTRSAEELRGDTSLDRHVLRNRINHRTYGVFLSGAELPEPSQSSFTDEDVLRVAKDHEGDDTDGLQVIYDMAITDPFMHFDTATFNKAFDQVMRIVHPEHYAA
ncbi:hypothetical protein ACFWIB_14440 [Streptomyces sp. NPDC127051]|uniref:hypothetical protein n=1 Tax=Streptomyces sp. NPDC127051 TaxID=3347119 RepID=UPI00365132E7